jgi:predicted acylesterase/phospholipase RssA
MFLPPRRIILSGGGVRAVAHLGALKVLLDNNYLKGIREWIGVSAGALICFLFTIGYTYQQIELLCKDLDFGVIRSFEPEDAIDFFDSFGLDSGENLERLLQSLLRVRGLSVDLTFGQAIKKGFPLLRVFATDLNLCKIIEYSAKKTPNVPIRFALRASMSLPLYFKPIEDPVTGHLLTDGGILANYPIDYLTEDELNETLGFTFNHEKSEVDSFPNFMIFCSQIAAAYYVPRNRKQIEMHSSRTIVIPCGNYPSWNFEASIEDRLALMKTGEKATREFLLNGHERGPRSIRRYSIG